MKVPEDRNPCLTLFAAEKKPALRFTKNGEVLKSMHEIAMEAIRSRPSPSRDLASLGIIIPIATIQWRRKMLVVRGVVSVAKNFRPHPLFVKTTPILSIRCCWARVCWL